jgi:phosphoglycerol transferase MdoB-like AlkP superfamily enzyme
MMKIGKMRDDKKYIGRGIVSVLVGIVVSFLLSAVSLYFATDKYGIEMFQSYFENGYIVFLNTLPVFFSIMFVFLICNQLWIGISITSILVIVLSLINYFKLLFRDDPLLVEDLTLFSEMKNMTGRYKIHINRDMILWILGMTVVIFVVWKLRKIIKIEMQIRTRIISVIMIVLCGIGCMNRFILNDEYYQKTENIALINRWGSTQQFISRGFIYPFLYSSKDAGMKKPDGYNKKEIENSLKDIKEDDIPGDKKVNIIAIMMEAYGDFSVYPQIEFDSENDPYAAFNRIKEISYYGNLLTDIFAAGTVRTERRFITGADAYPSLRKNTYSYARYFTDQGYCVEGSHPCYSWFYNRINVNDHLGFSKYDFYESRYSELANGEIAGDNVLFPELYKDLKNSIDDGIPYFNLSVTYQNHGPYSTEQLYDTSYVIKQEDYTDDEYNILNNYLSGIKNIGEELEKLIEEIESLDEPCVLVAFGDHKPWLGEGNSVYEMLGIDLDVSTLEGFYNYYATPYIMYANDAAKQITGNQFVGEGADLAPNYLMNELFEKLGYDRPAFMKITDLVRKTITAHSGDIFMENGEVVDKLSDEDQQVWDQYKKYEYYFMNQKMK